MSDYSYTDDSELGMIEISKDGENYTALTYDGQTGKEAFNEFVRISERGLLELTHDHLMFRELLEDAIKKMSTDSELSNRFKSALKIT